MLRLVIFFRSKSRVKRYGGRVFTGQFTGWSGAMAINDSVDRRVRERRIFLVCAILFPLLTMAGFAQTYYLRQFFEVPPLRSMLVHLHGFVMTAWVLLFVTQIWLVRSKNVKLHMKLGMGGVVLALFVIVIGVATAISAAAAGSSVPGIPPLTFLVVPLGDIFVFSILFGAAIYYRKRAADHKRLMLLTAFNFLAPSLARLPFAFIQSAGPLWFFGFPDLLALTAFAYDSWNNGKVNSAFAWGLALIIISQPLRFLLGGTEVWLSFAAWVTG